MQINITNGTLTQVQETLSPASGYSLPTSITVTGASSSYSDSTGLITLTSLTGTMSITASGTEIQNSHISFGNLPFSKIYFNFTEVDYVYFGSTLIYQKEIETYRLVDANNNYITDYNSNYIEFSPIFQQGDTLTLDDVQAIQNGNEVVL